MKTINIAAILLGSILALAPAGGSIQSFSLTGHIVSGDGAAAVGVRVAAMSATDPTESKDANAVTLAFVTATQTDAAGRYRLTGLTHGRYFVAAGEVDSPTYYPGANSLEDARVITIAPGPTTIQNLDFSLGPYGFKVAGRAIGLPNPETGNTASRQYKIRMTKERASSLQRQGLILETAIEGDGAFEFPKVIPGTYTARVMSNSGLPALGSTFKTVVVVDTDVRGVELTIPTPVPVTGRIVPPEGGLQPTMCGGCARGPTLRLSLDAPFAEVGGVIERDGTFKVTLPEGDYRIRLLDSAPSPYEIQSFTYGDVDLLNDSVVIRAEGPREMTIQLKATQPAVRVRGRVVGVEQQSVASSLRVLLASRMMFQGAIETIVNPDGSFVFPRVFPGIYTAQLSSSLAVSAEIVVSGTDVNGIELVFSSPTIRN